MPAQELLEFIFRTRKEGNGAKQVQEELKQTQDTAKETGSALGSDLKDGAASALETFTGLSLTSLSVAGAIGGVAMAAKGAIDGFVEQANATRDMATAFGISAEQASAYTAIAGDLRIENGQLEMAFKTLSSQGIQPSIANLMAIADEYNAIQDPVERAQYAQDKFGRSALDMSRMLELGSEGIAAAAQEAKDYGLTLDNEALAANERYRAALDRLGDTSDALTRSFGEIGANGLSAVVEGMTGAAQSTMNFGISLYNAFGIVNNADAALLHQRVTAGDLTATMRYLTDGIGAVGDSSVDLGGKTVGLTDDLGEAKDALRENEAAAQDAAIAQQELTDATDTARGVYRDAIAALRDQNLEEAQRIQMEQTIKLLSGELTQEDIDRKVAIDDVTTAYVNGKISHQEYAQLLQDIATKGATVSDVLKAIRDDIANLPEHKKVVVEYNIVHTGGAQLGAEPDAGAPVVVTDTGGSDTTGKGNSSGAKALGGTMFAGGTTIINDSPLTRPEVVVVDREGNGQVLTQQQAAAALTQQQGGQTVQIFVDARGSTDKSEIERAAKRGTEAALKEAGIQADRRRRTG